MTQNTEPLPQNHYLLETSNGEILAESSESMYWPAFDQALAVACAESHGVDVHVYQVVGAFCKWVCSFHEGEQKTFANPNQEISKTSSTKRSRTTRVRAAIA